MKREARRIHVKFNPAEKLAWEQAVREEEAAKPDNRAHARELLRQDQATKTELTRVAELLKEERESQGLSQVEIQGRTGISRASLCRLENLAESNPTIGTLTRIADALGKTLVVGLVDK